MSAESKNALEELEHDAASHNPPLSPTPTQSHDSCGSEGPEVQQGSKKRGPYKPRSWVWDHFTVEWMKNIKHGRCKYCALLIAADSRSRGTTPLVNHFKHCKQNPNNKGSGQTSLCLGFTDDGDESKTALIGWKFDQEAVRKSIAYMLIVDELPFKFIEGKGFQRLMRTACPQFKIPSRWTISRDCYHLYLDEKSRLKTVIKDACSRVCLTTDSWTSIQRINYMCLTAHFIDNDWKLNKRIINFCPISSHKGTDVGKAIEKCLLEWGIDDVFTVTVDNASSNDVAVSYLKQKIQNWGKAVLGGKWMHVRCVAHIVNLVVNDGLKRIGESIECIRKAVRYVRQSPARLRKFKECAEIEKIECKKLLSLDVCTRWNSTYIMLDTAQRYERAFVRFEEQDPLMVQELQSLPMRSDWQKARFMVVFLENFYDLTVKVSGTKYVTSNDFFNDISHINGILKEMIESEDFELSAMAMSMKDKYDKYWGRIEKMNMIIFIAAMLDPRTKYEYFEFVVMKMYGENEGKVVAEMAKEAMFELFNEYKRMNSPSAFSTSSSSSSSLSSESGSSSQYSVSSDVSKKITDRYKMEFKKKKMELGGKDNKSELDKYLNEDCEDDDDKFDILGWWKANSIRFPILSQMVRDVLAVPISTVASESAFSTGGRVLDAFRSSLTPRIVQGLICAQDWLRSTTSEINVEETLEELEAFESALVKNGAEPTIIDL